MINLRPLFAAAFVLAGAVPALAQGEAGAGVQQAQKQISSGDIAGGIAALERIVAESPQSFDARLALGRALDLQRRHEDARKHLERALELATDENRNQALTALGISYAFESKAEEAARYYQRAFDAEMQADDRNGAAGLANALGRIYLESGNLEKAQEWYKTGHETSRSIPGLPAPQIALWDMRWQHALGRIAARRGHIDQAREHARTVKALLDKGGNEDQRPIYPYLLGYIALFAKDYRQAVEELARGEQDDPFVLGLTAQAYEKLGDRDKAVELYRKVLASPTHSINSAFARPPAQAFLR